MHSEDDWFRQNEVELLETARRARLARQAEREAKEKAEERQRTKALHFMKCPKCGHDLRADGAARGAEAVRISAPDEHCSGAHA